MVVDVEVVDVDLGLRLDDHAGRIADALVLDGLVRVGDRALQDLVHEHGPALRHDLELVERRRHGHVADEVHDEADLARRDLGVVVERLELGGAGLVVALLVRRTH